MEALGYVARIVVPHAPHSQRQVIRSVSRPADLLEVLAPQEGPHGIPHQPGLLVRAKIIVSLQVFTRAQKNLPLLEDDVL